MVNKTLKNLIIFSCLLTLIVFPLGCDFFFSKHLASQHYDRIVNIVNSASSKVDRLQKLHDQLANGQITPQKAREEVVRLQQQFSADKQAFLNEPPPSDFVQPYSLLNQWFDSADNTFKTFIYALDTVGTPYEKTYHTYLVNAFNQQDQLMTQSRNAYIGKMRELGFNVQ
jgi:hypothetical protein